MIGLPEVFRREKFSRLGLGAGLFAALMWFGQVGSSAGFPDKFFARYCFECHDDLIQENGVRLDDAIDRDWGDLDTHHFFERIMQVVEDGDMPPGKAETQPEKGEREEVVAWLHENLLAHSEVGGTVLRRLNEKEYTRTIEKLFGISYQVPDGFPSDDRFHGFENQGEDLVLSPPLMEGYVESAALIADRLFPPPPLPVVPEEFQAGPEDLVISYSSGAVVDGAMRLASKTNTIARSSTWPQKFEAKASGVYKVRVELSAIGATEEPFQAELRAKRVSDNDFGPVTSLRLLKRFSVASDQPKVFEAEVEIYEGETLLFYFANAALDSGNDKKKELRAYLTRQFESNPRLMAAWQAIQHGSGIRGGVGWDRVKEKLADPDLDRSKAKVSSREGRRLLDMMTKNPVLYVETLSYQLFEEGPALGIHGVEISGPTRRVEDDRDRERKKRVQRFLRDSEGGSAATAADADLEETFRGFLTSAFRRPVLPEELAAYLGLIEDHVSSGHSREQGMHLAIRTALISPQFLYRESAIDQLDDWELASRLSYFLTLGPPDDTLWQKAEDGVLSNKGKLRDQAARLLKSSQSRLFVEDFLGQWLGLRLLEDIMPDSRLLQFEASDREAMRDESELFFSDVLNKNLPVETLIDPDFTFLNQSLAKKIYGRNDVKSKQMTRVALPENSPYGGILGQAAVMMATANGVDTQPVVRGVWVLENVLGDPPPAPPESVPAITPDTRGAKTVRDLLDAHRSEESCARCHVKIDPLGYVLENFDPVGRWRTHYPILNQGKKGLPVDASGVLPSGEPLHHIDDLKNYIVTNRDQFAACLAEKLMSYATGRKLTYSDRNLLREIVAEYDGQELGLRDLILTLVESEVFRKK